MKKKKLKLKSNIALLLARISKYTIIATLMIVDVYASLNVLCYHDMPKWFAIGVSTLLIGGIVCCIIDDTIQEHKKTQHRGSNRLS